MGMLLEMPKMMRVGEVIGRAAACLLSCPFAVLCSHVFQFQVFSNLNLSILARVRAKDENLTSIYLSVKCVATLFCWKSCVEVGSLSCFIEVYIIYWL